MIVAGTPVLSVVHGARIERFCYNEDGDLMSSYDHDDENLDIMVSDEPNIVGHCKQIASASHSLCTI